MKKLKICIIAVMLMFMSVSGIYAVSNISILDMEYTDNVYKFSESGDINLPFIRVSNGRMEIDKDVNKSGFSFANESLSVVNNLKGIQVLTSSDTVRINGNIEYGVVVAPTVIVEGTIDRSIMIVSENVTISENAVIKEDLLCMSGKIDLLGKIEGSLLGSIGQANISGNIVRDLRANISGITLGEKSNIQGNIYLRSYNNIDISAKYPNAIVNIIEKVENTIDIWGIVRTSLIFALIYLLISNKTNFVKNLLNKVKVYSKSTALFGFACILLFPAIILVIIGLTIFGLGIITIPALIMYGTFMLVAFMLSTFITGSVMCEYISNKYNNKIKGNWKKLILAFCLIFVLDLLTNLPMIGYTLSVALCILSTGILFTSIFRRIKVEN